MPDKAKQRMRVLVVDEWLPYPLESGKKIRTFQLLAPLAQRHETTYLCYADQQREAEKLTRMAEAGFNVICVPPTNRFQTRLGLAAGVVGNLCSPTPLVIRKHFSRRFDKAVSELIQRETFDIIHCEWTHYAVFLRKVCRVPRFLCSHNVECLPWRRFSEVQANPARRAALYLEWRKMKLFERRAISAFDHVSAVSETDARIMQSWFSADSVEVIPNAVDTHFYEGQDGPKEDDLLVYCASMDAWVNQDAANYFVKRILPEIHKYRPQTRVMIVGREPPDAIRRLACDRVIVTGTVKDVRPLLAKATACIVPLRIAGGSRLKILEAFAAGLPVVSTSIGAEGLDVEPDRHLLIADKTTDFASACLQLLTDRPLRERLGKAGKSLAREKYDWSAVYPLVENAWEQTIRNYYNKTRRANGNG